jgi:hypothetical protein
VPVNHARDRLLPHSLRLAPGDWLLPGWRFDRQPDAQAGYAELVATRRDPVPDR